MLHALFQLLLYALIASFSAVAFAVTVAVLRTGRLKSLTFGIGFVAGQLLTCALFVLLGFAATGSSDKAHSKVEAAVELLVAVALVLLALRIRRRGPIEGDTSNERLRRLLERLERLRLLTMLVAGLVLGIGGPKRLLLTAFAATAISTSGVGGVGESVLVIWYVALATVVVWAPVLLFLVLGERIVALMTRSQAFLARHQNQTMPYALFVLAALFFVDAVTLL